MGVLLILSILPLFFMGGLLFIDASHQRFLSKYALLGSFFILNYTIIFLYGNIDISMGGFQFFETYSWLRLLNLNYTLAVDAISLWFILLTNFLILICVWLGSETVYLYSKWFYFVLFITQFCLLQVFLLLEIVFFYIMFEAVLIPMFLLIMIWGSRERKIHAAYQFFFYTLAGSFLFLLALFLIYTAIGSTDYLVLISSNISEFYQLIFGIALFIAFGIKIPLFPVHIWLPEAHVEAPTAGSVLLAGVMLKMGGYGLLRFFLPLCSYCVEIISPIILTICIIGVFYTAFTTLRQIDMKKIIAYSSIGHMSFVVAGLIAGNVEAVEGSIYLMLTHGIVSPALFLCVGVIYDRYGSRLFSYYGGLTLIMPLYIVFFYLFILANFSLPGTASFVAEILVIVGLASLDIWVAGLLFLSGAIGLVYSLWLINRVASGFLSSYIFEYVDLSKTEFLYLFLLAILTIFFGLFPKYILQTLHVSVSTLMLC